MTISNNLTVTDESASTPNLSIEGISESVILRYFETMNAGEYDTTAALFADEGRMYPPFEQPIEGTEAIATYLKAEATGMQLFPRQGISQIIDNGDSQIQITGKVQTPWFSVNVRWIFVLNPNPKILSVKIKLLASPQELLSLRRSQ
ncbi:MAG TPA: nuclear transport factor 2 [Cyanobacteria bacterium UBA12227]|nr:nuclear transport factor 2 [Cyanobacteria bacterium UBA12227]HAX88085.1 nuclear transport factor 2 [Cyanobacteria bacterium UBA11370]HBY76902.1 nuclear transport factor 2 [Cyanobacteria bacterium UBA11148]